MKVYETKVKKLAGTDYHEVHSRALTLYKDIKRKTKRRPYVRSAYFKKDKIFLDYFWQHLWGKNWRDRVRRLKYYPCALDLIKNSRGDPTSKQNPNNSAEILHRFAGITRTKELFFIQIKEDKKTDQKSLISIFPEK